VIARAPDSRTAILDAAELLFSERGFSATTIRQIATSSNQNSALIYYYFVNKATLYRHVLDRVASEIAAEGAERAPDEAEPDEVVRAVVQSQVAVFARRPHLPVLIAREIIDWRAAHAESAVRQLAATLFDRLCRAIESGQRTGTFHPSLDPRLSAISVISQVAYVSFAAPVAGILLGRGTAGPTVADVRAFGDHAAAFALAALRAPRPGIQAERTPLRPVSLDTSAP
jgi:AcrR family transcriptional regulator